MIRNHSYCQSFLKKPFQRRFLSGKMFFFLVMKLLKTRDIDWKQKKKTLNQIFIFKKFND